MFNIVATMNDVNLKTKVTDSLSKKGCVWFCGNTT